jgi:hypothetical protein
MELSTFMWRSLIIASIFLPLTLHATAQERPAVSEQAKPLPQPRARLPTNCGVLTATLKAKIDQMKELQKRQGKSRQLLRVNAGEKMHRRAGEKMHRSW